MKELRIGLVLYGGASLAVYMNGAVTEVWHLLRASRATADGGNIPLDRTAEVYAGLLKRVAPPGPGDRDAGLRVVVDAVAGTSAGGVNGIALAKAVAEGGDAALLNGVWLNEADIEELRKKPALEAPFVLRKGLKLARLFGRFRSFHRSIEAIPGITFKWARDQLYSQLFGEDGRKTPLKGGNFAKMIARTLDEMGATGPDKALLPTRGTFDLLITATDLHGWPRHLPVSRGLHATELEERTHAHAFHFRRRSNGAGFGDDFALTFAARATAGFPLAFAPMGYADAVAAFRDAGRGDAPSAPDAFAARHFPEHRLARVPLKRTWLLDGGILDNRPFGQLARAIERKPADHEVYRRVLFLDPDPEADPRDDFTDPDFRKDPDTAMDVGKALLGLLRHEPIYEDLRRLRERNAAVARIRGILDDMRPEAEKLAKAAGKAKQLDWNAPAVADLDAWREAVNVHAAKSLPLHYPGYARLKVRRATETFAGIVNAALGHPYQAGRAYRVRRLLRIWVEVESALDPAEEGRTAPFKLSKAETALLKGFDVHFRLRRLRHLVHHLNARYADADPHGRDRLDRAKKGLATAILAFEDALEGTEETHGKVRDALGGVDFELLMARVERAAAEETAAGKKKVADLLAVTFDPLYQDLRQTYEDAAGRQHEQAKAALGELDDSEAAGAMQAHAVFPFLDTVVFPLMDAAGLEDLIPVQAMRISPQDGTLFAGRRSPLKSRDLYAFNGFLERSAREHDLIWGRLDGAERLIDLVVEASGADMSDEEKQRFKQQAANTILAEEFRRPETSQREFINALQAP